MIRIPTSPGPSPQQAKPLVDSRITQDSSSKESGLVRGSLPFPYKWLMSSWTVPGGNSNNPSEAAPRFEDLDIYTYRFIHPALEDPS